MTWRDEKAAGRASVVPEQRRDPGTLHWRLDAIPGADLWRAPTVGAGTVIPSIVVRRWVDGPEPEAGSPTVDYAADPGVHLASPERILLRGIPLAKDRWVGRHWFGLRLSKIIRGPGDLALMHLRWLLWNLEDDRRVTTDADVPEVDVQGSCAVAWSPLMVPLMDAKVHDLPRGWRSQIARSPADGQRVTGDPISRPDPAGTANRGTPATAPAPWTGFRWRPLEAGVLEALAAAGSGTHIPARLGKALEQADLAASATGSPVLSGSGGLVARTLQTSHAELQLVMSGCDGDRVGLKAWLAPQLAVAEVPDWSVAEPPGPAAGNGSAGRVGMSVVRAEDLAELVVRAVRIGASDTKRLTVNGLSRQVFLERLRDPLTPLPSDLAADETWRSLWASSWTVWRLQQMSRTAADPEGQPDDHGVAPVTMRVLTAGPCGNYVLMGDRGDPGRIRLVERPTSDLFHDLISMVLDQPTLDSLERSVSADGEGSRTGPGATSQSPIDTRTRHR